MTEGKKNEIKKKILRKKKERKIWLRNIVKMT